MIQLCNYCGRSMLQMKFARLGNNRYKCTCGKVYEAVVQDFDLTPSKSAVGTDNTARPTSIKVKMYLWVEKSVTDTSDETKTL